MRLTHIRPEFVSLAPAVLEPGVVYVSMEFATVLHLCCCGCRKQVVTPLTPARWHLGFDGESITLNPSIGNWSFPCRSHYWIRQNAVVWDRPFSPAETAGAREKDRRDLERHAAFRAPGAGRIEGVARQTTWFDRAKKWLQRSGKG